MLKRIKRERQSEARKKGITSDRIFWLLGAIALAMTLLAVYRYFLATPYFPTVLTVYMVTFTALILVYVIYNRGFSRRNLTKEMLNDTWSSSQIQMDAPSDHCHRLYLCLRYAGAVRIALF